MVVLEPGHYVHLFTRVGVRDKYADNIRRIYGDDPSIQVHGFSWPYGDDTCRRVSFLDHFRSLGYEILVPSVCCWGGRTGGKPSPDGIAFYRAFYIQSDLNYDLRWKFSHINRNLIMVYSVIAIVFAFANASTKDL